VALASFVLLAVNQVDIVNTVDGVNRVNGVDSPILAGSTRLAITKLLISMPLCIMSLTTRFKASDVQAITKHSKT
jgi:hypothetical protein